MKFSKKNDFVFTSVILFLEIILILIYLWSVYRPSSYSGSEQVGNLVLKKGFVSFRHADSLHWNILLHNGPVYAKDSIRTGSVSEAEIVLGEDAEINLLDKTFIKLRSASEKDLGEMMSGSIIIKSGKAGKSLNLAGKTVVLDKNSRIIVNKTGKDYLLEVTEGSLDLHVGKKAYKIEQHETVQTAEDSDEVQKTAVSCVPVTPEHNAKFVTGGNSAETEFSWIEKNRDEGTAERPVLYVFSDKACTKTVFKTADYTEDKKDGETVYTAQAAIAPGTFFWYAAYPSGLRSPVRKFTVLQAQPSVLLRPANGAVISYRTKTPAIRFGWTGDKNAAAALLEIAADPEFKDIRESKYTASTDFEVAGLTEGSYYWRVTPQYRRIKTAESLPLPVHSFKIEKKDAPAPLSSNFPPDGYICDMNNFASQGFAFSWQPRTEAAEYELLLYKGDRKNENTEPAEIIASKHNFVKLTEKNTALFSEEGTLLWSVRFKDTDGTYSPESPKRLLIKTAGNFTVKALYPPDNYHIAQSLVGNQRFSWKSTAPEQTYFVLTADKDGANVITEKAFSLTSFIGLNIKEGDYYWHLRIYGPNKRILSKTEVRKFSVVSPLPPPLVSEPAAGSVVPLFPEQSVRINWHKISSADYYEVSVYDPSGTKIFSEPLAVSGPVSVPIGRYPTGRYTIRVQAFKTDSPLSTRNIGLIGSNSFQSRKISYVELQSPSAHDRLAGDAAYYEGVPFHWFSEEPVDRAALILKKEDGQTVTVKSGQRDNGKAINIFELEAGRYEWTVQAFIGNFDISPKQAHSFTVLPMPPLPAPEFDIQKMTPRIDGTYLKGKRSIECRWFPAKNAQTYSAVLKKENSGEVIAEFNDIEDTMIEFSDLKLLSEGTFVWVVQAQSLLKDGKTVRKGQSAEYRFDVALPSLQKPVIKPAGEYYGY